MLFLNLWPQLGQVISMLCESRLICMAGLSVNSGDWKPHYSRLVAMQLSRGAQRVFLRVFSISFPPCARRW